MLLSQAPREPRSVNWLNASKLAARPEQGKAQAASHRPGHRASQGRRVLVNCSRKFGSEGLDDLGTRLEQAAAIGMARGARRDSRGTHSTHTVIPSAAKSPKLWMVLVELALRCGGSTYVGAPAVGGASSSVAGSGLPPGRPTAAHQALRLGFARTGFARFRLRAPGPCALPAAFFSEAADAGVVRAAPERRR